MANDIIDINVYETVETVAITVNPNLTTVNINQSTPVGVNAQNLQSVTDLGSTTTNSITANSFIKSGGTGANVLLDNGTTTSLTSIVGTTNLGYTASPTNGIVTSNTGTDATLLLADGTNAGLLTPAEKTKITNTSGTNTGDNATNSQYSGLAASKYDASNPSGYQTAGQVQTIANAKVSDTAYDDTSWNGVTTIAPSKNAVRDKIQSTGLQQILAIAGTATIGINIECPGIDTAVYGGSIDGKGVWGYSEEGLAGEFGTNGTGNIVDFKSSGVLKTAIQNDGKITATAGTASTDVVVKSQLDAIVVQTITNGVTATAPSQDAVFDALALKANDNAVVHTTGAETIAGAKTFSTAPILTSLTASQLLALDANKNIQTLTTATYPSLTELAFVKGATSNLQTQLNQLPLPIEAQLTYLDMDYTIFDAFYTRVIADSGTIESTSQLLSTLANLRSISYTAQGYTQQINADKFVKLGGTAEKYLMANGSALSNIATNATTTALSLATLNSTYPTAIIGFRVHCINITIQKVIYEKTSTGWVNYSITVIT